MANWEKFLNSGLVKLDHIGLVDRAFATKMVDSDLIPDRAKQNAFELVFITSLLDIQH